MGLASQFEFLVIDDVVDVLILLGRSLAAAITLALACLGNYLGPQPFVVRKERIGIDL